MTYDVGPYSYGVQTWLGMKDLRDLVTPVVLHGAGCVKSLRSSYTGQGADVAAEARGGACVAPALVISQKVFINTFRQSQFPHKFVNLLFMSARIKDKLTNLYGD